jgi:membrane-bound lytic murein transglycosylase B
LRGGPPLTRSWPRHERMLTKDERRELQTLVTDLGFELGTVDGKVGPKTRAAMRTRPLSAA